jgi:diguanylate cyclase (GGDEF)-like protein/PAS domain S-box-containing protein
MGFMLMIKGRAERALRESETRLRAILDNSRDAIAVSKSGIRTFANPAYVSLFGYESADELIGKPITDIVAPESRDFMTEVMKKHVTGEPFPTFYEETVLKKYGSQFPVETSVSPFTVNGEEFALAILRDVTDRKKAEEEVRLLKHSIDVHYDGAYWMDTDNRFVYVNDAVCRTLGYERGELIGTSIHDVNPGTTPERMKEFWEGFRKGGSFVGESVQRRKDGTEFPVEVVATHVRFGGREFACGFARDITDRKNAEEALRWKTTFLEALVHSSQDGILVLDSRMQKVAQNQRLLELWSMPADVAGAEDPEQCLNFLMASIKNPEEFYKKLMHLYNHPDETVRGEFELNNGTFVEAFSYPVLGKDSVEQYGRIWMFRDVTEIRRYWDMLENLSTTDGLTGISNRRRFDEFLEREWRRSMREYSNLSLLIVDIDYFKEFNDRYGHLAGDDCLKQVAVTLGGTMRRASDLVARYGGDEFTCVLPGMGEQRAVKVAQRIVDEVARLSIPHESSSVAEHVTVSIGVATEVPEKGREFSDLMRRADRCLYAAKEQGRNRVVALPDDYSNKERCDDGRSRGVDRAGT